MASNKEIRKVVPPAYQCSSNVSFAIDKEMYENLSVKKSQAEKIHSFEIPIRTGQAWIVKAGHLCRIVAVNGPQVGDFNMWNLNDPRERMWATRTRQLQSSHLKIHDRIWSTLPFLRPLATITDDSLSYYGVDDEGGRVHDLLGTRCDPYVNKLLTGEDFDYCCHSNLVRAVLPFGLNEFDVHDVVNIFQCTGLNINDQYFMKDCPAKKGDYFEFFAEVDLLCALSVCPSGDQTMPLWGPEAKDLLEVCRPLGVEIFKPKDELLEEWKPPTRANEIYRNMHGIKIPFWADKERSK